MARKAILEKEEHHVEEFDEFDVDSEELFEDLEATQA